MALADDIQGLTNRTLSALSAGHDYHTYTKRIWRLTGQLVKEGRSFSFRNVATGSRLAERELLDRLNVYLTDYLIPSTFQGFVSRFEDFYFGLLRCWLTAHPGSLSRKHVEMRLVLAAPDKTAIIALMIEKELNEIKYARVADWFAYLERLANIQWSAADVEKLAEIKASRDVIAHNNGFANETYVTKSGSRARCQAGERLPLTERYLAESWQTIRAAVSDLAAAALAKAGPQTSAHGM